MGGDPQIEDPLQPRPRFGVRVSPLASLFLWGVALWLLLHFWGTFKLVLLGFIAAWAVSAMLRPIAMRMPGPRGLKALIVLIAFIAVVGGCLAVVTLLMVQPVQQEIAKWPQIKNDLDLLLYNWSMKFGIAYPASVDQLANQLGEFFLRQNVGEFISKATDLTASLIIILGFIFIGSMYLLAEPPGGLLNSVVALLPLHLQEPTRRSFVDLERPLRSWLLGTLVGMIVVGIASYLGYSMVGLQFAAALAIFAGLSEAVPTLGPIVTLILALLLGATQGPTQIIGVSIVYAVVQTLESYVLIPLIMQRAVNISPVVTLFSIVFWGELLGLPGLLLAIPLDLVAWSLLDHLIIRRRKAELHGDNED